ncbi:unnamed protein product [Echinostoma caproni]|uniref:Condensin complex subunit 2 n=1 Tax=Echinostoma caproni TaxID=27848 RepID=A0A183AWN4_9TREM|nr:unnamed protein product [Echinostoma caproni]
MKEHKKKSKFIKPRDDSSTQTKAVELNPYWNDGGSGIPEGENASQGLTAKSTLTDENEAWLYKSYKRCLEQAKEQKVPVRQLLLERWNEATVADMLFQTREINRMIAEAPEKPSEENQVSQTVEREVTDADINEMAAKVLRAELSSNTYRYNPYVFMGARMVVNFIYCGCFFHGYLNSNPCRDR